MDYIRSNKAAWEEAFDNKADSWCADIVERLASDGIPYLEKDLLDELVRRGTSGKSIAQFCCNNGRELLSAMKLGFHDGTGFDIAENQVAFANDVARRTGIDCAFVATDILDIGREYYNSFDVIIITIGALCWFKDLDPFFLKASRCLKHGGRLFINETHPVCNMLAATDEDNYDAAMPGALVNDYFDKTWTENDGIGYIAGRPYKSRTFTSFSHSFSKIINALSNSGFRVTSLEEYDYDIAAGMFSRLERAGIPLSYILSAEKL